MRLEYNTGNCIIAMRSQTYASRGKKVLSQCGIHAAIVSIDPALTRHGCSFGLEILSKNCSSATECLTAHHVPYGDVLGVHGG